MGLVVHSIRADLANDFQKHCISKKPLGIILERRKEKCQQSRKNNKNVGNYDFLVKQPFILMLVLGDSRHYFEIKALKRGC